MIAENRRARAHIDIPLILMVCGGILGSIFGRIINKKMNNEAVDRLFIGMMSVIILISMYNAVKYWG